MKVKVSKSGEAGPKRRDCFTCGKVGEALFTAATQAALTRRKRVACFSSSEQGPVENVFVVRHEVSWSEQANTVQPSHRSPADVDL